MIYTCTLNPSVDYQIDTDKLEIGALNRVEKTAFYPGGKGINVSRVLNNMEVETTALGFIGGFTGTFILEKLNNAGVKTDFVIHEEPTRINIKIKTGNEETEVNGSGTVVTPEDQAALVERIKKLNSNDFLVLSGSLPPAVSFDLYDEISFICSEKGISFVLDIPNHALKDLLKYRPFLIKPNQKELSGILGVDINTKNDAIAGAKELTKLGAQNVVVSMGGEGAVFVNHHIIAKAENPPGELKSSVGAGDSLVGGFLASYLKEKDFLQAFRFGVASGSATAFSDDLCKKEEVEQLVSNVSILQKGRNSR